jgi:DMSO reductase family type II enzyme chaperone
VARGALYRLAAHGFRDPDARWLEALDDARRDVVAVGSAEDADVVTATEQLLAAFPSPDSLKKICDLYCKLFGHTVAGDCPLYETEYGEWAAFQQPHTLADLMGSYRAFGLVPASMVRERPDHISLECEYLYVLAHKEAWAHEHDGPAEIDICVNARRLFLSKHLGRWAPALANRLARYAPDSFYARLSELLIALVRDECRSLNVKIGDSELAVGQGRVPVEDACVTCSDEPEGAGTPGSTSGLPLPVLNDGGGG